MPTAYAYCCRSRHDDSIFGHDRRVETLAQGYRAQYFSEHAWGGLSIDGADAMKKPLWRRPVAEALRKRFQAGDVFMFSFVDRCFESSDDWQSQIKNLRRMSVTPVFLDLGLVVGTPASDRMIEILNRILNIVDDRRKLMRPIVGLPHEPEGLA